MREITVNQFRSHLKESVEDVISSHDVLKVTRRGGDPFVVVSAEDWEREQETLHVLSNSNLMRQIAASTKTHQAGSGYSPTAKEIDEIHRI